MSSSSVDYKMLYVQRHELCKVMEHSHNNCLEGLFEYLCSELDEAEARGEFTFPKTNENNDIPYAVCPECNAEYPAEWGICPFEG